MDPNTANVAISAIQTIGVVITAVLSLLAVLNSRRNTSIIKEVQHQTNSLMAERIDAEKRVGVANSEIARGAGRDAEREVGNARAKELLHQGLGDVTEVNVVEAIPLEIKK